MRIAIRPTLGALIAIALVGACIAVPEGDGIPPRITAQDDAGADTFVTVDGSNTGSDAKGELPVADPHTVIGVDPPHGPFSGGRHAVVRGNGFKSNVRVWFGDVEVTDVTQADPTLVQVTVPPGAPGEADVRTQNGSDESTSRTLPGGYTYDAFYTDPSSGPTSGGTVIRINGSGTAWVDGVEARMGDIACLTTTWLASDMLECTTPSHAAGAVAVSVASPGDSPEFVYDAYTYTDSDNGFKGGLSGSKLSGMLKVSAYNGYTGEPISKAWVVAGDDIGTAIVVKTDINGIVVINDASLSAKRSVTIAKDCYEPTTFVDVPVDTVTAYLSPVMSAACLGDGGEVPPVGGKGANPATIKGELVWIGGTEFKRAPWSNVPGEKTPDEQRAAYVFQPQWDPSGMFGLPDTSRAIRTDTDGSIGYDFSTTTGAGNITLYALAGIENRSVVPPTFTAYAFGFVQGISTTPGQLTENVYIKMDKPLDQALVLSATPPAPGPQGPDRLIAGVSVQLGNEGYAVFPNAVRSLPIAATGDMTFVGLPGLDGVLSGAKYVSSARAVTGANQGTPMSIVGKFPTTDATIPVHIEGFVQIPQLVTPGPGEAFDGQHLEIKYAPGGAFVDVTVFRITAASGLVEWLVSAPAGRTSITLPDLAELGMNIPSGPVTVSVYGAHISDQGFDYGTLQYRHLDTRGWLAHAYDTYHSYY